MISLSPKDKPYMAIIDEVLKEVGEFGEGFKDLQYPHHRAAFALCLLERMRGKSKRDVSDEYYWQEEVGEAFKSAVKEKHAREHMVD